MYLLERERVQAGEEQREGQADSLLRAEPVSLIPTWQGPGRLKTLLPKGTCSQDYCD